MTHTRAESKPKFRVRHARTPRGNLAYFDEGSGPALICAHGLGGDLTHFEHVAPPLASDFRVIGLDLPGMGGSPAYARRTTIEHHAHAMLALMDSLGLDRATLVGHSAGGLASAMAALIAPERIESLVLINAAGLRGYPHPLRWFARAAVHPRILRAVLPVTATHILDHVFHQRNAYTRKFVVDSIQRPHEPTLTNIARSFHDLAPDLLRPTIAANAHRLTMPVLIVWGDRDRLVPLPSVARVARSLPRGTLRVVESCGHMPIIERPEETVALIRAFLGVQVDEPAIA